MMGIGVRYQERRLRPDSCQSKGGNEDILLFSTIALKSSVFQVLQGLARRLPTLSAVQRALRVSRSLFAARTAGVPAEKASPSRHRRCHCRQTSLRSPS